MEQNFQPQGRDTTNGPHIHTYIPRADGSILVGGIPFVPQSAAAVPVPVNTTISTPAVAGEVPTGVATSVPVVIKPGEAPETVTGTTPGVSTQPLPVHTAPVPHFISPFGPPHMHGGLYPHYAPAAPIVYQQPYMNYPQQPYPAYAPPAQAINYPAPYGFPIMPAAGGNNAPYYTNHIQQPAFGQYGLTQGELMNQQMATAVGLEMNTKQEMKPADDDPLRYYWVRELDNTWTQRNRITIDSGDIGACRWYNVDGMFYAVRLPDA